MDDIVKNFNALQVSIAEKIEELTLLEEQLHVRLADVERRERVLRSSGRRVIGEKEYGAILGLKGQVTISGIKSAYRRLASALHPDKHTSSEPIIRQIAEEHLKQVNDAYTFFRAKYQGK